MKKRDTFCRFALMGAVMAAGVVLATGCRPKPVVQPAAPQNAADAKSQAREAQTERYILNRRATARKNNRGHSVH